jgi:2-methylcitrate dehydratase PrpD
VDRGYVLDERAVDVNVHPVARQAAHLESVGDGLAAKFSIPYCVAHTLMHGPPRVGDFVAVDGEVLEASRRVAVTVDASLPEFGAVLRAGGEEIACVRSPRGSPERPASRSELAEKVADLAGNRLDGVLDDLGAPAAAVAQAAGLVR